jgi:hypothetical protein
MNLSRHERIDPFVKPVRLVLAMLPQEGEPTVGEIDSACDAVEAMLSAQGEPVDRVTLQRKIEALVAVWQDAPTGLQDAAGHVEWLAEARAERTWDFWERYRRYLEDVKLLPPQAGRCLKSRDHGRAVVGLTLR